ncbi:MAG: EamA family transporter [Elusimicrobiota bacterium]
MSGPLVALLAAALFGVTPALLKPIAGGASALALAGLLYLGSGLGLLPFALRDLRSLVLLRARARMFLLGTVLFGGALAPALLLAALRRGGAFEVSAMLNLECVATALLARIFFREHVAGRIWGALALLCVGGALTGWTPGTSAGFSSAAFLAAGACVCWGLDNNLTRELEEVPPSLLAFVKGLAAGVFNLLLALLFASRFPSAGAAGWTLLVGALGYGLSLVLLIGALRALGAARAGAYFAAGPFIGMFASALLLGENPTGPQAAGALLMAAGVLVLHGERHEHPHSHAPQRHRHPHSHDEHHAGHRHEGDELEGHEHVHEHAPMTHTHTHWPDVHHRH